MILHEEAGRILKLLQEKKSSLKNLVFNSKFNNKPKLNALVAETVKYDGVLIEIITNSNLQKRVKELKDVHLCKVVVYEYLFGKMDNLSDKYQALLKKNSTALNSELAKIKIKLKVIDNKDLIDVNNSEQAVKLPKYVRVNTNKTCMKDVLDYFKHNGYANLSFSGQDYKSYIEKVKSLDLNKKQFLSDPHVPDLLVFPPGTTFHEHPLYVKGDILLQDKASCLSALALAPPPGSQVIDCCAAPGNKTSYLSALMNNQGKIYAFDRDAKRFSTLNTMLLKFSSINVDTFNQDFLRAEVNDPKFESVEYILVDPSCSGSGIVDRIDYAGENSEITSSNDAQLKQRLTSLSNFQAMVLNHAMRFPSVKKIVYSTCSLHEQENEAVVREILSNNDSFKLVRVFPEIESRGIGGKVKNKNGEFDLSDCVRLGPTNDLTNGFFVACFVRIEGKKYIPDSVLEKEKKNVVELKKSSKKRKGKEVENDGNSEPKVIPPSSSPTREHIKKPKNKKKKLKLDNLIFKEADNNITTANSGNDKKTATHEESMEVCEEEDHVVNGKETKKSIKDKIDCQKMGKKLLKKRQRPKHKKPIVFLDKNRKKHSNKVE